MEFKKIKVGIVGGAGYTAGELIRTLMLHPHVAIKFVHSRSNAGKSVTQVHDDLHEGNSLNFTDVLVFDIDVLFLCLGHGESKVFLSSNALPGSIKIIDLTNDFRIDVHNEFLNRDFVYGLPELNREKIRKESSVANPGCFATAMQLSLLPLIAKGIVADFFITGITGSTGAGQSLSQTSHFSWRQNNIQAYKVFTHQHLEEVGNSFSRLNSKIDKSHLHFVPWRGDFTGGIFMSTQLKLEISIQEILDLFIAYYADAPFVQICKKAVHLKQVVNTNKCWISLEQEGNQLVIHTAIDNLLEGAVGQAIQNMNLMCSLEETTGLQLKPSFF